MSCAPLVLSAYKRCYKTRGGVAEIYLIDKGERESAVTIAVTASVASSTLIPAATEPKAYRIIPRQNTWNFTQPRTSDNAAGGTSFVTQNLTGPLHDLDSVLTELVNKIGIGRFEAVVVMANGKSFYLGLGDGLEDASSDNGYSGTAKGDANGVTITLTSEDAVGAPQITDLATFLTDVFDVVNPA